MGNTETFLRSRAPASEAKKVQATVDAYTAWVIRNLVGTGLGSNPALVVASILQEWIRDNGPFLAERGLGPPKVKVAPLDLDPGLTDDVA